LFTLIDLQAEHSAPGFASSLSISEKMETLRLWRIFDELEEEIGRESLDKDIQF